MRKSFADVRCVDMLRDMIGDIVPGKDSRIFDDVGIHNILVTWNLDRLRRIWGAVCTWWLWGTTLRGTSQEILDIASHGELVSDRTDV